MKAEVEKALLTMCRSEEDAAFVYQVSKNLFPRGKDYAMSFVIKTDKEENFPRTLSTIYPNISNVVVETSPRKEMLEKWSQATTPNSVGYLGSLTDEQEEIVSLFSSGDLKLLYPELMKACDNLADKPFDSFDILNASKYRIEATEAHADKVLRLLAVMINFKDINREDYNLDSRQIQFAIQLVRAACGEYAGERALNDKALAVIDGLVQLLAICKMHTSQSSEQGRIDVVVNELNSMKRAITSKTTSSIQVVSTQGNGQCQKSNEQVKSLPVASGHYIFVLICVIVLAIGLISVTIYFFSFHRAKNFEQA